MVEGGSTVTVTNLSPIGLGLYVVDEVYLNDDDDLFSGSETGG